MSDVQPSETIDAFAEIVGTAPGLRAATELVTCVAGAPTPVLLTGPTGTGKEVFARAIHELSPRSRAPFTVQNCGALTETLLESTLYGHRRGAFSGAITDSRGLFRMSDHGTLLLDEIGEASPSLQVHLLRVLEDGRVRAIGDERVYQVDVRVIAATNRDLAREVETGRFRADLYARLAVFPIELPTLDERRDDIPALAAHFLKLHATRLGRRATLSPDGLAHLLTRSYPGNVRELKNLLERGMLLVRDGEALGPEHLTGTAEIRPSRVETAAVPTPFRSQGGQTGEPLSLDARVQRFERAQIVAALERHGGKRTAVARELGISSRWLLKKLQRYGLARRLMPLAA
jgi:transcriptional regulator with GAF, ATPase, and Fis domain